MFCVAVQLFPSLTLFVSGVTAWKASLCGCQKPLLCVSAVFFCYSLISLFSLSVSIIQSGRRSWCLQLHHSVRMSVFVCCSTSSTDVKNRCIHSRFFLLPFPFFPSLASLFLFCLCLSQVSERHLCAPNAEYKWCLDVLKQNCLSNPLNTDWDLLISGLRRDQKLICMALRRTEKHIHLSLYTCENINWYFASAPL